MSSTSNSNSTEARAFVPQPWFMATAIILFLVSGGVLTGVGLIELGKSEPGAWRWTQDYLGIFVVLALVIALVGLWRGPRTAGLIVGTLLTLGLGATVPVAAVVFLTLSTFAVGRLLVRAPNVALTDVLLVGIVAVGTVLSILVHLPINNAGSWGLLFALPLVIGWRHLRTVWPAVAAREPLGAHLYLLYCAIGAAALLHLLVALMPEVGHDALAMHLFVPAHVAHHQAWYFDTGNYVWAVMPMFVDWLYTAAYLFAGETAARLVNAASIMLLATLVHRSALWAGANRVGAGWAVLLLLVTPLTFLESSSLFIEGMWSALALGGTLALLRLLTAPNTARTELMLASAMLAGAVAVKAVTFIVLPVLALLLLARLRRWFARELIPVTGFALLMFVAIGAVPYVRAYVLTGNPVFPFFNGYFQSPLYPPVNFSPPAHFELGFAWDTLYRITFDSSRYLDATIGSAGFQWLLLVVPGLLVLALARRHRALVLGVIVIGWMWLTFGQTAYLRYVLPSFALACAVVAVTLSVAESSGRWAWRASIAAALGALALNLLHLHAATWYGEIDLRVITDPRAREAYIDHAAPVRTAVELVNALNHARTPVAFFSSPLTAGLEAEALYANWYNTRFLAAVNAAADSEELARLLAREQVEYVVLDEAWKEIDRHTQVRQITTEITRISTISVRRLDKRYRDAQDTATQGPAHSSIRRPGAEQEVAGA
jgi:hypothetical protein